MTRVNPNFIDTIKKYIEADISACFSCGTCTAVCPLTYDTFPRKMIRYIILGLEEELLANPKEVWMCLHCGLCTETCPRNADPGEIIHGLKKYIISKRRGKV